MKASKGTIEKVDSVESPWKPKKQIFNVEIRACKYLLVHLNLPHYQIYHDGK